jgi:hypothetical protein
MICKPCHEGRHRECVGPECDCADRQEEQALEQRLLATRQAGSAYTEVVLSTLQGSGSPIAKLFLENAGMEKTKAFVSEILATAKALRC